MRNLNKKILLKKSKYLNKIIIRCCKIDNCFFANVLKGLNNLSRFLQCFTSTLYFDILITKCICNTSYENF